MSLPNVCPKCQRARQPGQDACPQCGLLVTRWEGFKLEVPTLEPVDQAWSDLQAHWSEDDAHRRFLELAAQFDGLDVAAALYKQRGIDHPHDPRAREGLGRAVTLAQDLYAAKARDSIAGTYNQIRRMALIIGAILLGSVTVYLFLAIVRRP